MSQSQPAAHRPTSLGRGLLRTALAVALATLSLAAVAVPGAVAASGYLPSGTFDLTGPGALAAPQRVAVESSTGNILVVDSGNDRIAVFAPNGDDASFLTDFGGATLDDPFGVAIDQSNGDVYVSDAGNARVVRFESDGAPTPTYTLDSGYTSPLAGSAVGKVGNFRAPLAVAPNGDLLVADKDDQLVQRYDSTGAFLSSFDGSDTPGGAFTGLLDVAIDPDGGEILVVDSSGGDIVQGLGTSRVERFGAGGAYEASIGQGISKPGLVTVDPDTGYTVVAGNLGWFNGPTLFVFDGTDPVAQNAFAGSVNGGKVTGLAADGGATSTHVYAVTDVVDCCGELSGQVFDVAQFPTVTVDPVSDIGPESATLNGTVNPNGLETTYYFEYSSDGGANWSPFPIHSSGNADIVNVGAGTSAVTVSQPLSGLQGVSLGELGNRLDPFLQPNTTYEVRIRATNATGGQVSATQSFTTDAVAPYARTMGVGPVGSTSASVGGQINPRNQATTYRFEYGTADCSANPCDSVPVAPVDAGSDNEYRAVAERVSGLSPATVYHYRIVATSSSGTTHGADRTFVTADAAPPDFPDRAYEQVSPIDKNGADIRDRNLLHSATPAGDKVVFGAAILPGSPGGAVADHHLASRDAGGWTSKSLQVPESIPGPVTYNAVAAVSEDLTKSIVLTDSALTPEGSAGSPQLYLRDADGSLQLLTPEPGGRANDNVGASGDFSHVAYSDTVAQTDDPVTQDGSTRNLYEWVDGQVRLVGLIDPDGAGPLSEQPSPGGSTLASNLFPGSVPADGSRVFFLVPEPGSNDLGQLYARENGTATVHVSASQRTTPDPAGPLPARYWAAEAEHGSKVLFSSCEKLTDDSTARPAAAVGGCDVGGWVSNGSSALYLYDLETGDLTDLTASDPDGGKLAGVVDVSDDLGRIYFIARGELAPGGVRGQANLYLWDHGTTSLVATVHRSNIGPLGDVADANLVDVSVGRSSRLPLSRVTSDGSYLAFASRAPLAGYDNSSSSCALGGCAKVYLYDAVHDRLECVSCPPDGDAPAGDSHLAGGSPHTVEGRKLPFNLLADGTLFFNSPERLVPADTDGTVDVYEWRDGRVNLVSSGSGASRSFFYDATPDGSSVFFTTRDPLVGSDDDSLIDLYVARVGGGFPEPTPAAPCQEDDCQGEQAGPPALAGPGSQAVSGRGDAPPAARASLRVARWSAAQRRALASGRPVTFRVAVNRAGKVSAVARARLGRTVRVVGTASKRTRRAGTVRLRLKLSPRARQRIARGRGLEVSLSVRFAGAAEPHKLNLNLRPVTRFGRQAR
jgi:hypothetical protein